MPRSSKTSNVLKLLNIDKLPDKPAVSTPAPDVGDDDSVVPAQINGQAAQINGRTGSSAPTKTPEKPKKPRKNITKNMKLGESNAENPALKALPPEEKYYVRMAGERQIVSIPLMLVNEQLGAAVERFNVCACNECLRTITDKSLDLMEPMYVRVVNSLDENEVNRLMKEGRAEAIRVLAKVCISAPGKAFCGK